MTPEFTAAIVASIVSILIAIISFFSNRASTEQTIRQSQFSGILSKRIEFYPRLWKIHITYETNWTIEGKKKDRKWAQSYLQELNKFNSEAGIFFSQDLYSKFAELRDLLCKAVDDTMDGSLVNTRLATQIRNVVYGSNGQPGLSTFEKDDLGSYRNLYIQRRKDA